MTVTMPSLVRGWSSATRTRIESDFFMMPRKNSL
jgi:hypothetical protein